MESYDETRQRIKATLAPWTPGAMVPTADVAVLHVWQVDGGLVQKTADASTGWVDLERRVEPHVLNLFLARGYQFRFRWEPHLLDPTHARISTDLDPFEPRPVSAPIAEPLKRLFNWVLVVQPIAEGRWRPQVNLGSHVVWESPYSYAARDVAAMSGATAFAEALGAALPAFQPPVQGAELIQ